MGNVLEICSYSIESAKRAQSAGADRIELCAGRPEGGTTPSYGALVRAQQELTIPAIPMVRPRGGDFTYRDDEFASMITDIELIGNLGYSGVVIGILDEELNIDVPRTKLLIDAADNMTIVFHRAFDLVPDPITSIQVLAELGVDRVLTSGQKPNAADGIELLHQLIALETGVTVMPGGGVRPGNVSEFLRAGAQEIHSSATTDEVGALDEEMVQQMASLVHTN